MIDIRDSESTKQCMKGSKWEIRSRIEYQSVGNGLECQTRVLDFN